MNNKAWQRNLPVPFFSQRENTYVWYQVNQAGIRVKENGVVKPGLSMAWQSCNITSLCMILQYLGIINDSPDDIMKKVFEEYFPEWRQSANGIDNLLSRWTLRFVPQKLYGTSEDSISVVKLSLDQCRAKIAAGYPVWFSFGPLSNTGDGHIAVLRGFTNDDGVIINDPWGDVPDPYGRFAQNENHFNENVAKNTEVKIFHSNPFAYTYSQIDTSDDLRKQIKDINDKKYIDSSGNVFFEAMGEYSSFFIKEKNKDLCYKTAYDWKEWFFDYIPEDSNSLLCGKTSITEDLIEWYEKLRENNDWLTLALAPWWTGPYLTWEFLKSIFGKNPPREETEQMQEEFRHCICTHPIEWDAAVSSEVAGKPDKKTDEETISSRYAEFLKSQADATDLWNGGLSAIFQRNSLNFVHPVYFINHLEKAGAFEFNPYKGTTYAGVKVVNNPGFAPYLGEGKGINGYAPMTWAFNGTTTASKTIHAGIDFAIDYNNVGKIPIHSLIQGFVIADIDYGDDNFGNCILVQSSFNPEHYYLVAHMSRDKPSLKKDDKVYPGKVVGYVGNTGKQYTVHYRKADGTKGKRELQAINNEDRKYGYGAHLHLQFMKADHLDKIYTTLLLLHHTNVNSYNPIDYTIGWKG